MIRDTPQRRSTDHSAFAKLERWLAGETGVVVRTIWLFMITIIVVIAVAESKSTANQATDLARAVQQQRLVTIRSTCEELNRRHDGAIAKLNQFILSLPTARRAQAKANEKYTIGLIDALDPKRDCDAAVRAARLR